MLLAISKQGKEMTSGVTNTSQTALIRASTARVQSSRALSGFHIPTQEQPQSELIKTETIRTQKLKNKNNFSTIREGIKQASKINEKNIYTCKKEKITDKFLRDKSPILLSKQMKEDDSTKQLCETLDKSFITSPIILSDSEDNRTNGDHS